MVEDQLITAGKAVAGGLAILGVKDLLVKLLGPTADYLGGAGKGLVEKCNINLNSIFQKAWDNLGNKIEEPGTVNPRILKEIVNEGSYCEDELAQEYFAGILASSRTEDGKDDRGVTNARLVSDLSSYQIKTHYIFYTLLRKTFLEYDSIISPGTDRRLMYIYIPTEVYFSAMDTEIDLTEDITILTHSVNGLQRNDLLTNHMYGSKNDFLAKNIRNKVSKLRIKEEILCEHGIIFEPTPSGMELYLWAHGISQVPHQSFLSNIIKIDPINSINLPERVEILYKDYIEKEKGLKV